MKAAIRSSALARIFLVAGFGVALSAMPASAQKAGGSITVGLELDIPGFDPLKVGVLRHARHSPQSSAIFDTLTTLDDKGKPQPKLALSWTHSEDFKTWTFKLRPGVKFHDGTPFNAASVQGEFRPAEGSRQQVPLRLLYRLHQQRAGARRTDGGLQSERPVGELAGADDAIQSQNNAVHSPTAWKTKGDDYNRNPVGTGPYILKSWTAGDRMVLEKNPDYWDKDQVYLDRIIAEAAAGRAVALRQPAIGRGRYHLGRRIRRRQYPEGAKRSEADGAHLCRVRRRRSTPSTPRSRRSTTCACARRW